MGKQKQQVISRFFAPKPKTLSPPPPPSSPDPPNPIPNPPKPSSKISATVSFSPSKRIRSSQLISPSKTLTSSPLQPSKKPKISPHTQNPDPSLHQKFLQKLLEPSPTPPLSTNTNQPSSSLSNPKYTPLEQQVVELKSKYPDVLLMVEVGYKYRFFGEDAEIAARVLGIYAHIDHNFLTASIPTFRLHVHVRRLVNVGYKVGVVKQTETAAIKAHGSNKLGPFTRGLSALYTKATLEAAEDMGGREEEFGSCSNYLICVVEKEILVQNYNEFSAEGGFDVRIGIIAVEISTGDVIHGEFNDNVMRNALEAVILSLSPAEILLGEPLSKQTEKLLLTYAGPTSNVRVERASRYCFKDGGALAEVMSSYENIDEDGSAYPEEPNTDTKKLEKQRLGIEGIMSLPGLAVQALAITIRHLKKFGLERILCLGASFRPFSSNIEMTLSANALQQLEVLKNNSDGAETGSLLHLMNHTLTTFGSRLLRHWVTHPLRDRSSISARLDAVSEIAESMGPCTTMAVGGLDNEDDRVEIVQPEVNYIFSTVLTTLGRSADIQRGITRIFHRTATAAEFVAVIHAILFAGKQLQQLRVEDDDNIGNVNEKIIGSSLLRRLILTASSSTVVGHAAKLLSVLNKDAASQGDLQNLFNVSNGQFPEVSGARTKVQMEKDKLDLLISQYRKQLRMHNLEFLSVSGATHLIELPSDVRVPSNWVKVSSTKKTIRYHPPEVSKALDQLLLAKEELTVACRVAWDGFLEGFGKYYAEFQAAVQALAALDCLHSLAILSRNENYVRPVFVDDNEPVQIQISSGRHPVLDSILQDNFVPNDTNLHADGEYCQIVTGPNMGGKSCYIRQVALIVIMAQVGSFVPASSAKLHVLDGIHTRMGSSDSIQQGRSTFFEELSEASHILHNCTPHSLIILDELGRGTSTHDGVAIAYATLHYLLKQIRCMVLFVTHYPKIVDVRNEFPAAVGAYHVSYLTSQNTVEITDSDLDESVKNPDHSDITFLYKVVRGMSDKSFGLNVARLAQLPSSCVARAAVMAARLEAVVSTRMGTRLAQNSFMETNSIQNEDEVHANYWTPSDCSHEELTEAYHKLFCNLTYALGEADPSKSFQTLKHTSSLAVKMMKSQNHRVVTVTQNVNQLSYVHKGSCSLLEMT
ncbi:DNA mismatch repair protein MutS [Macleaya cordata]|uniref:DNA mismatch repair protein n=1 Tax=Macleaya cordata TaxID=56857 RepID=A0A200QUI6_MACCD|nr:DNA mismatch repair protein MutS [Macleaya cordata]